jgi:hypothetical protein
MIDQSRNSVQDVKFIFESVKHLKIGELKLAMDDFGKLHRVRSWVLGGDVWKTCCENVKDMVRQYTKEQSAIKKEHKNDLV